MVKMKNMILILLFTLLFIGCGSGGTSSSAGSNISGIAQKGPFRQASVVKAYYLQSGVRVVNSTYPLRQTTTNDDKGTFSLTVPWSGPTEYEISGEYLDENTGNYLSNGKLSAIVNSVAGVSTVVNINIFTHLAASQIKEMLKQNKSIQEAKQTSKDKIKDMFALELEDDTQFEDLDLTLGTGSHKTDNAQLLQISAALLSSNNPDLVLEKLSEDLKDGIVDDEALDVYKQLKDKADTIDLDSVNKVIEDSIGIVNAPSSTTKEGILPFSHGLVFDKKVDVNTNELITSNYIVINNLVGTALLSVSNAQYSLNDEPFTSLRSTLQKGDRIQVRHTSSANYSKSKISSLIIGTQNIPFETITESNPDLVNTIPNIFSFPIKYGSGLNELVQSDTITVSGLTQGKSTSINISKGSSFQINNNNWSSIPSTVINGDIIKVQTRSNINYGGKKEVILTIGTVEGKFLLFTKQKDIKPDVFTVESKYEYDLNTTYETPYFHTNGYEGGLDLILSNGEVQLEGESVWLAKLTNLPSGYNIKFRQTSSSLYGTSTKTLISFGNMVIDFETVTKTDPSTISSVPSTIKFKPQFNVSMDSYIESPEREITGMNGTTTYIYISNGSEISLNEASWTDEPVAVTLGDKIKLRVKTGLNPNTKYSTTLFHGPTKIKFAQFNIYTKNKDTIIDDISFTDKYNINLNTYVESEVVTIQGIDSPSCATIINGEFKFNGNNWTSTLNKVCFSSGQTLQLRHQSTNKENDTLSTIVNFDTQQFIFKSTTVSAPVFLDTPPSQINQNSVYDYTPSVKDSQSLTYSLINKPSWMQIESSTGIISGYPRQGDIGKSQTITLKVKSNTGLENTLDFQVTVIDINDAPVLSNTWSNILTDEHKNFSKSATAIDIEGGNLTWSLSNNPFWLTINSQTGELSGIPRQVDVGLTQNIKVVVTEEEGLNSSFDFNITVIDKNSNAFMNTITDKTVNENELFVLSPIASDLDGDILIFAIQNKPSWSSFDTSTGKLEGTPNSTDIGLYENVTISVTDGHGSVTFETFKITVLDVNEAPTLTSTSFGQEFILDDTHSLPNEYSFSFLISDVDKDSLTVTRTSEITQTRVGFGKTTNFANSTLSCIKGTCTAVIKFGFQELDGFHSSLKTRHTFTVSDGNKTANNYIDIWYAPTKPILSGETAHIIEVENKTTYEAFSFTPINSGNKASLWGIKNKPTGFDFDTSTGELKSSSLNQSLLDIDTLFKDIKITASNDRGVSNIFIFSITVKGKPQPKKFEFRDLEGVEIQQFFDASITVDWLEDNEQVSISSSDYLGQSSHTGFRVNEQTNVSVVKNGDRVTVWHKSSNEYDTQLNTTITIGNESDTFSTTTKETSGTKIPLIVGSPMTGANINQEYSYTPQISTDYTRFAPVTKPFEIENKPSWATFDTVTGTLSGTPIETGNEKNVRILAMGDNGLDDITFNITISNDGPYINGFGHSLENPDLSFTFLDNSHWRSQITKVSMYACYDQQEAVILNTNDYTFSEGGLKLHSSVSSNSILHIPVMGGGRLIIESEDYENSEALIDMVEDGQYAVKAILTQSNDTLHITLSNYLAFSDEVLDISNFILSEAPNGTFVKSVEYITSTTASLTLGHNGIKNEEALNIKLRIANNELNVCQDIESNSIVASSLEEVSKNVLKTGLVTSMLNEDDAFYKKGQTRSYAYTDNIDYHNVHKDMILDNQTKLIWQNNQNVTLNDYSSLGGDKNWDKAKQYCENLTLDSYDDWRLPSIEELLTLVDYSKQNPSINPMFENIEGVDSNTDLYFYWSSTPHSSSDEFAWFMNFKTGEHHYHGKISGNNIKCVRGAIFKENQFTRTSDGIVTDFSTNLSWQDNEIYHSISINDAISYCQNLSLGGNSQWRVPNANELSSILNHTITPLNISEIFQYKSSSFYYTSTHNILETNKYWLVGFQNDGTDGNRIQSNYKTRCVSGTNISSHPSIEAKIINATDTDADYDHITLGIELKDTTFSSEIIALIRINRAPDKDVVAGGGFVYVDDKHAYIIVNMENISEDIIVSFSAHNSVINYSENITSNSILIEKPDLSPIAEAGEDQNITHFAEVTLDASNSSDKNGNIISYEWKEEATVLSTSAIFNKSDFTVGEHIITLKITDNDGEIGTDTITIHVAAKSITHNSISYNIISSPITGKKWLDRNLGANEVCTKSPDDVIFSTNEEYIISQEQCFGDLYQWGRLTDGHEKRDDLEDIPTLASSINNAGNKFIITMSSSFDWLISSVDSDLRLREAQWIKTDGSTICPVGFRVPTITELVAETVEYEGAENEQIGKVKVIDRDSAFKNFLKLPYSGGFELTHELIYYKTTLWSSTPETYENNEQWIMSIEITANGAIKVRDSIPSGSSVRCIIE